MWLYYMEAYSYIFIIISAVISLIASLHVKSTYAKYSRVMSMSGITADQAAERILHGAGIGDVPIEAVAGNLTDHYNPKYKTLGLSQSVYGSSSVAANGVAAHECGHAIQDEEGYLPIRIRSAIVPVVNFGSTLSWPAILFGMIFGYPPLITIGIYLFVFVVIFQLITLPVEFNASRRAVRVLEDRGILGTGELKGAKAVLRAAAMTYLAAALTSLLQLARLLLLRRSSRR